MSDIEDLFMGMFGMKNVQNKTTDELREIVENPIKYGEVVWWEARKELTGRGG